MSRSNLEFKLGIVSTEPFYFLLTYNDDTSHAFPMTQGGLGS